MLKRVLQTTGCLSMAVVILMVALACSEKPEPAYASATTESILVAFNEGNYTQFSENFSEDMKNSLTDATFAELHTGIKTIIGDYVSKEYSHTEVQGELTIVYYKTEFTQEPEDVVVKIVFQEIVDGVYVDGLWFDSPKLRGG